MRTGDGPDLSINPGGAGGYKTKAIPRGRRTRPPGADSQGKKKEGLKGPPLGAGACSFPYLVLLSYPRGSAPEGRVRSPRGIAFAGVLACRYRREYSQHHLIAPRARLPWHAPCSCPPWR